jgi:hypothetical protein
MTASLRPLVVSHGGQASGTVQDGAANRWLWSRIAADKTVTGRRGVIRVFLSVSPERCFPTTVPENIVWDPAKNYKYPSIYRETFCPSRDNTGVTSVRYQLPLCSVFVFIRWGILGYEYYGMGSSTATLHQIAHKSCNRQGT